MELEIPIFNLFFFFFFYGNMTILVPEVTFDELMFFSYLDYEIQKLTQYNLYFNITFFSNIYSHE